MTSQLTKAPVTSVKRTLFLPDTFLTSVGIELGLVVATRGVATLQMGSSCWGVDAEMALRATLAHRSDRLHERPSRLAIP